MSTDPAETDPPDSGFDPAVVAMLAQEAKKTLRKRARGLRASIPKSVILSRSNAIVESLLRLECISNAKTVALFFPMEGKNEVDLRAADENLRARGVAVCYPAIEPASREMTFHDPGNLANMVSRGAGFLEPDASGPGLQNLDVVVVPALLVDPRGHRLGYGAGYYDRALAALREREIKFTAVIVAFDFQLAADLPVTETDVPGDMVVTDKRVLVV